MIRDRIGLVSSWSWERLYNIDVYIRVFYQKNKYRPSGYMKIAILVTEKDKASTTVYVQTKHNSKNVNKRYVCPGANDAILYTTKEPNSETK